VRCFYKDKQPIDVIIGNSYDQSLLGVFVVVNQSREQSLAICKNGTPASEAAVFRLYPDW
jgi:hypothetical protein